MFIPIETFLMPPNLGASRSFEVRGGVLNSPCTSAALTNGTIPGAAFSILIPPSNLFHYAESRSILKYVPQCVNQFRTLEQNFYFRTEPRTQAMRSERFRAPAN